MPCPVRVLQICPPIPQLHLRQKHPRGFGERVQLCGDEPFVPNSPSSLVLATSSRTDIDSLETEITHVSLGELDVDDSLDLFVRVAYGLSGEEVQQVLPHDEVEEIHSVLEHCLGLPLAIRACASILRRKRVSSAKELHRKLMRSNQDVFRCREMDEV